MRCKVSLITINFLFTLIFLVALLVQPVLIDDNHFDDTTFLAHLGWRGVNGLSPVVDYPHFYGGVMEKFLTWSFHIFGVRYLSINYAFAMMFGASTAILWLLGWKRIPTVGLSLLTALSAALILSLSPIELGTIDRPRTAHSFVYNHSAIVLMMALTLFALKPTSSKGLEHLSALIAGLSIYVLLLLKTTFAIFFPFLILACLLNRRWSSSVLAVFGAVIGMVFMDPGFYRALGSLTVLMESAAAASVSSPKKLAQIVVANLREQAVAIVMVALTFFLLHKRQSALILGASVLLCFLGYAGSLISMGGRYDYKMLPILVVFSLVFSAKLVSIDKLNLKKSNFEVSIISPVRGGNLLIAAVPFSIAYSYIFPAALSAIVSMGSSFAYRSASLISSGPAEGYIVAGGATFRKADILTSVDITNQAIEELRSSGRGEIFFDDSFEYVMFSDGINLLRQVPNIERYGIISNGRMFDFTMPLMSPPVVSFPVWPTQNLDVLRDFRPLEDDVDIVMISEEVPGLGLVNELLFPKMGKDFVLCRESALWQLFVRSIHAEKLCND